MKDFAKGVFSLLKILGSLIALFHCFKPRNEVMKKDNYSQWWHLKSSYNSMAFLTCAINNGLCLDNTLQANMSLTEEQQNWYNHWVETRKISKNWIENFDIHFFLILNLYWELYYFFLKSWDFLYIYLFPKILCLRSFGNSQGNSYKKKFIPLINFHFPCGKSKLYIK